MQGAKTFKDVSSQGNYIYPWVMVGQQVKLVRHLDQLELSNVKAKNNHQSFSRFVCFDPLSERL